MMRMLLTFADPHQVRAISPYGLEILRGHLRARHIPVEVRISNPFIEALDPYWRFCDVLDDFCPDLIGFSMRNIDNAVMVLSSTYPSDGSPFDVVTYVPAIRRLVNLAREWNADVPVVMGGAGFTSCPEECLRDFGLDYGLIGPAEAAFCTLIEGMLAAGPPYYQRVAEVLPTLPGAVYRELAARAPTTRPGRLQREQSDAVRISAPRPLLYEEPAYTPEIAPEYRLFAKFLELPVAVRTKTGCPLRCAYCIDPINMRPTYYRPLDHVIADFAHYIEEYDLHKFHIADSEVNLPKEDHLIEVCQALVDEGLADRQRWHGYFNIRPCSDRLIDALMQSHCYLPAFGVDSFDDRVLALHQKNFKMRHVTDVLDRLIARNDGSMTLSISILFGEPGETLETVQTTIAWMKHYAERGARVGYSCGLRVYPRTPLALLPEFDVHHLYVRPGSQLQARQIRDGYVAQLDSTALLETVVYCSPLPPRELAAYVASQCAGYANINVVKEGAVTEAGLPDFVRYFNVGVYHLAYNRLDEARTHLTVAQELNPTFKPLNAAFALLEAGSGFATQP